MKPYASLLMLCLLQSPALLADSLRVVSEAWPPYVFEQNGRHIGVDLEVAEHVLESLGYDVSWELLPWKRALRTVTLGRAQAILDIVPSAERVETLIFPDEPLATNDTVLFFHKDRPHRFETLADLSGLKIGVSPGYTYGSPDFMAATGFVRESAPTFEANLAKLVRGRLDMVAMDRRVGLYMAQQLGIADQLDHNPRPLASGQLYLAFHRSDALVPIAAAFGPALRAFKQTSEYAAILARYGQSAGQTTVSADPVN